MSASKIVRNNGSHKTVVYGGGSWEFPGGGNTTMVPGDVADFVEQNCFREGLQVVHPEAEAAERERLAAIDTERAAAQAIFDAEGGECRCSVLYDADENYVCGEFGKCQFGNRTKSESGVCDECIADHGDKPEPAPVPAPVSVPRVAPVPDPPAPSKPAKPVKKAAAKKR